MGAVVYTGRETKIQMNSADTPFKTGSLRKFTDRMTFYVFLLQVLRRPACRPVRTADMPKLPAQITCCTIGGIAGSIFVSTGRNMWYIWAGSDSKPPVPVFSGFLQFWTFIIIFTNFIPISLLVTLDMVKFFQVL
jgi:magnesium-transporting ATPase (P-type)